jgi:mannitol PTS system EIIA component
MADAGLGELLSPAQVRLGQGAADWEAAVRQVGGLLVGVGSVEPGYVEAMVERERSVAPTFVGEGVAIPHGTLESRALIRRDALCVVSFPDGVDWQGDRVVLCIGIAARDDRHVPILARLAELLMEPDRAEALRAADTPDRVVTLLTTDEDDADGPDDSAAADPAPPPTPRSA